MLNNTTTIPEGGWLQNPVWPEPLLMLDPNGKLIMNVPGGGILDQLAKSPTPEAFTQLSTPTYNLGATRASSTPFEDEQKAQRREANRQALNQYLPGIAKTVGTGLDTIGTDVRRSKADSIVSSGLNVAADAAISSGNPYAMIAGLGYKGLDAANRAFGPKTNSFTGPNENVDYVAGAYTGAMDLMERAKADSDKKWTLTSFGQARKANKRINAALAQVQKLNRVADEAYDRYDAYSSMSDFDYLKDSFTKDGGWDWRHTLAARQGAKLEKIDVNKQWTPSINTKVNIEINKDGGTVDLWSPTVTVKLKNGGKAPDEDIIIETKQPNLIPEGALHKNKHHLDATGFDDAELTKKGIPVVDNSGNQQAEIELNEIIFNLEVTKKLEELYREFYKEDTKNARKEELALLAGKLLHDLIINNTDDRTGLINSLQKGGTIGTKQTRSIDELIEEAKRQNPRFIQCMSNPPEDMKLDKDMESAELAYYTTKKGAVVYPTLQEVDGKLKLFTEDEDAIENALKDKNILTFNNAEEAELFTKEYKKGWPEYFNKEEKNEKAD